MTSRKGIFESTSVEIQTDYRENNTQTDPCTLTELDDYTQEIGCLRGLEFDYGLPVQNSQDLNRINSYRKLHNDYQKINEG